MSDEKALSVAEQARAQRRRRLAAEVAALELDADDRAEMSTVTALMAACVRPS